MRIGDYMKQPKKRTKKEKQRLSKLLKRELKGLSNAEIDRILEEHDRELPGVGRWLGD